MKEPKAPKTSFDVRFNNDIKTKYAKLEGDKFEYGYWSNGKKYKEGVAPDLASAMIANSMTTTTAPDMRPSWRK